MIPRHECVGSNPTRSGSRLRILDYLMNSFRWTVTFSYFFSTERRPLDGRLKEIDVEMLQRAFKDSEMGQNQVARELGWCRDDNALADGTRFARAIGLKPYQQTLVTGKIVYRRISTTSYERAVKIVTAMGLEPTDYGL